MKEYIDVLQKLSDGSDEGDLLLRRLNKELSLLNIPFPTLGGELFWSNEVKVNGWKLQKNDFIDHVRLLNAQNICVAWGTESGMKHALKKVARYAETLGSKDDKNDYNQNIEKLKSLKELLDIGAITEEEFNENKKSDSGEIVMIRQVRESDREALGRVFCFGWKAGYKGILPDGYLDALTVETCTPKGVPSQNYFVAEYSGDVVGLVNVGAARDAEFADSGELRAIYVHPEHWQNGFGRALFDAAAKRLAELGYPKFYLWVLRENGRARRFYEKMGMRLTGDGRMLSVAGTEVAEVRYEMALKK